MDSTILLCHAAGSSAPSDMTSAPVQAPLPETKTFDTFLRVATFQSHEVVPKDFDFSPHDPKEKGDGEGKKRIKGKEAPPPMTKSISCRSVFY